MARYKLTSGGTGNAGTATIALARWPTQQPPQQRTAWHLGLAAVLGLGLILPVAPAPSEAASPTANTAAITTPKAYVGLFQDNAVGVIDTGTNQEITTIPVPAGPHGMVLSPDGDELFVS